MLIFDVGFSGVGGICIDALDTGSSFGIQEQTEGLHLVELRGGAIGGYQDQDV